LTIVLSVLLWLSASDYPFGIFWPLCCLSFDFSSDEVVFFVFHFIIHTFSMFFFSICCGIYNFLNFCVSSIVEHWYFIHKWYFQCIQ
jgi:hypothetical protein